jgi:hypothetical protein
MSHEWENLRGEDIHDLAKAGNGQDAGAGLHLQFTHLVYALERGLP